MREAKKTAAIMAAVNTYLEEESDLLAVASPKPVSTPSFWHTSGRQEIMQMRALWQRRIVPR